MTEPKKRFRHPMEFIEAAESEPQTAPAAPAIPPASAVAVDVEPVKAHRKPWDTAHPKMRVGFAMRLPEALHMKLEWLSQHIPKESMHSIALAAIEKDVERLIAEYYETAGH